MYELFKGWINDNHPDLLVDNEERVIKLMFAAFMEGVEEGKVAKADHSFIDMLGNDDCGDACKI